MSERNVVAVSVALGAVGAAGMLVVRSVFGYRAMLWLAGGALLWLVWPVRRCRRCGRRVLVWQLGRHTLGHLDDGDGGWWE